jgi:hypothetical protein
VNEVPMVDDDLARQRRKREARLLDQPLPDFPALTVADVVADTLAASADRRTAGDAVGYMARQGHSSQTINTVLAYLQRQGLVEGSGS